MHGTKDHLLPIVNTQADIKIKDGGHLMVYDEAEKISRILIDNINNHS